MAKAIAVTVLNDNFYQPTEAVVTAEKPRVVETAEDIHVHSHRRSLVWIPV